MYLLRARPEAERVFVEYEDLLNLYEPADRHEPNRFQSYLYCHPKEEKHMLYVN